MPNTITGSAQPLPTVIDANQPAAPAGLPAVAGGGGTVVTTQPLVSGSPAATDAALLPQPDASLASPTSGLTDAALANALGTSAPVTGGGAPGQLPGPPAQVPAFVQGFSKDAQAPELATQAGVIELAAAPGQQLPTPGQVQQGWAWVQCPPATPGQGGVPPAKGEVPPSKGDVPPATGEVPPAKGDVPPSKGDVPTPPSLPPTKGGSAMPPPLKGTPPTPPLKGGAVDPVGDAPRRTTYTVKQGDWLSTIADKLGVSWQALYKANRDRIDDPNLIYPGQVLRVPGAKPPVGPPGTGSTPPPVPGGKGTPPGKGEPPVKGEPPTKGEPTPPNPPTTPPRNADRPDRPTPPDLPQEPPVEPPKVEDGPPGTDPGANAVNPPPPPVPDDSRLPPDLPTA